MRTVTLSNGKSYNLSPLTMGQLKKLEKISQDDFEDKLYAVCEMVGISELEADDLPVKDGIKLQNELYAETFGTDEEVKN